MFLNCYTTGWNILSGQTTNESSTWSNHHHYDEYKKQKHPISTNTAQNTTYTLWSHHSNMASPDSNHLEGTNWFCQLPAIPPAVLSTCSGKVYDNILHLLHSQHRQVDLITGDGNCLFRSLFNLNLFLVSRQVMWSYVYFWPPKNKMVLGKFCNGKFDDHCGQMARLEHKHIDTCSCIILSGSNFHILCYRNWGWKKFKHVHVLLNWTLPAVL